MDRQRYIEMLKDSNHDFRQKHLLQFFFINNNDEYLLSTMDDLEVFSIVWDLDVRYKRHKILMIACENNKPRIIDHIITNFPDNYNEFIIKYNLDYPDSYKPNNDDLQTAILNRNFSIVQKIISYYKNIDDVGFLLRNFPPMDKNHQDILNLILKFRPDLYISSDYKRIKENNDAVLQDVYSKLDSIKKSFIHKEEMNHFVKKYLDL